MALELKNKVSKEKTDKNVKVGKYKRKRNVFGKRLTRIGIIILIIAELLSFASVKVAFTMAQNKKQKQIDADIKSTNNKIQTVNAMLKRPELNFENVGNLIATLPTSFDQQATSLDLDRMIILSGLSENQSSRKISKDDNMPFDSNNSTLKCVKIELSLRGDLDDINSVQKFISYLSDYHHENFYYVRDFEYTENRGFLNVSETKLTVYTFYNDVTLTQ